MATSYGSVTVTSTATLIIPATGASSRKGAMVFNAGTNTVYIGPDANVTAATGIPLGQNTNIENSGSDSIFLGDIYGITASASSDVRYWVWSE